MTYRIGILLVTLALSSCSTISPTIAPPTAPKTTTVDRQAKLQHIQNWQVSGKIAIQTPKDSGSASVNWTRHANRYVMSLSGPLGSHGMTLSGQPGKVMLQTADGKTYHATSAEQLLATRWGFNLPVSNMNYWIRGLPAPGMTANSRLDADGRLQSLIQQGWRVDFLTYSNTQGVDLPEKLAITSPSLKIKIVIYQWNIR